MTQCLIVHMFWWVSSASFDKFKLGSVEEVQKKCNGKKYFNGRERDGLNEISLILKKIVNSQNGFIDDYKIAESYLRMMF